MPVRLDNHPIAYWPSPKVACTSIKLGLYELDTGKPWLNYNEDGQIRHIHNAWKTERRFSMLAASDPAWRFAVVRDPIDRLISAYGNRVVHLRELSEDKISAELCQHLEIRPNPSLNEFAIKLDRYWIASKSIAHHTRPQHSFLGPDLDYFHGVYEFKDLPRLPDDIRRRTGLPFSLPAATHPSPPLASREFSRKALAVIRELFMGDYILLKRYYSPQF